MLGAMALRYPAMGPLKSQGFPAFLGERLGAPGVHLRSFGDDLSSLLRTNRLCLVDSGASANLVAALVLASHCGLPFGAARGELPKKRRALASGFSHPSTLSALHLAGFDVSLVDTEEGGFGISPEAVKRALEGERGEDVAVVCVTHFLGFPARIDLVADIAAAKHVAWTLQDACDTLGLHIAGYPIHAWATFTTYALDPESHLAAYGGGAIATDDGGLFEECETVSHLGRPLVPAPAVFGDEEDLEPEKHLVPAREPLAAREGLGVEMSDLDACYGLFALESAPSSARRRAVHYGVFYETLSQHPKLIVTADPFNGSSPYVFPVRVRSGDARAFHERLTARGIEVRSAIAGSIVDHPAFAGIAHDGLVNCKKTLAATVVLSIHPSLPTEDVEAVAELVAEVADKL